MHNINDNSDIDLNKEDKYRKEIFQLLRNVVEGSDSQEVALFERLFTGEQLDNDQLLKLIASFK